MMSELQNSAPETVTIKAGGDYRYNGHYNFFRLKKVAGADEISARFDKGLDVEEIQPGHKKQFSEKRTEIYFQNNNASEVQISFYALNGVQVDDDVLVIDPDTPMPIDDSAGIKVSKFGGNSVANTWDTKDTTTVIPANPNRSLIYIWCGNNGQRLRVEYEREEGASDSWIPVKMLYAGETFETEFKGTIQVVPIDSSKFQVVEVE